MQVFWILNIQSYVIQHVVSYGAPVVCILYLITFPLEMLIEMEHKSLLCNGKMTLKSCRCCKIKGNYQ